MQILRSGVRRAHEAGLAAFLCIGLACAAAADPAPPPPPGTLLRVKPAGHQKAATFRATLLRMTADSLWVNREDGGAPVTLALADVRLQRFAGHGHGSGAVFGGGVGLLLGVCAGTLAAVAENIDPSSDMAGLAFIYYPAFGAAIGLPAGAVVGGLIGRDEWTPVP